MARKNWTKIEDDYLREYYDKKPVGEIAEYLDRSKNSISHRAFRLGIKCGRFLTEEEHKYIEEHARYSNKQLATFLGRSDKCIRQIRVDVYGSVLDNNENKLTFAEIERVTGHSRGYVRKIWVKKGLKYKEVGKYRLVTIKNLCEFMKEHPSYYKALNCEKWFFDKYDWFNEKLKQEALEMRKKRWGEWCEVV